MSSTKSILLNQPVTLIDASIAIAAGNIFALPTRASTIGVQFSVDVNAGNFTVDLEVSIDGVNFFSIKTMTQADLVSLVYVTNLAGPYAMKFIRGNVSTNSTPHAVTLQILCIAND